MEPLDIDKPMEAIQEWQDWYRKNRDVNPADALTSYCTTMSFQKAKEHFADTIAEFANELSGKELYKAFYSAAIENMECVEKEYNKAKQLVDMLRYKEDA